MGNCVSSQSQQAALEKQAASGRGRSIVSLRKVFVFVSFSHKTYLDKPKHTRVCSSPVRTKVVIGNIKKHVGNMYDRFIESLAQAH